MTDAEFWAVMAITCEKAGTLPDASDKRYRCSGLCSMLLRARDIGLINERQYNELKCQMGLAKPRGAAGFWWPPGELAPRVRAMKELAKLAER